MTAKCKFCKATATLKVQMSHFCSIEHAYQHARKLQEQARKRKEAKFKQETRQRKDKLKSRSEWLKDAQAAFNKYIRLRDSNLPCISCGRFHQGQWHAGHYLSVGAHPELRFNEKNVWRQCQPCNMHLSGNLVNYRKNLIDRIGILEVENLEGPQDSVKLSIEDLKEIKKKYIDRCKIICNDV